MQTKIIATEHAQERIPQRGDDIVNVISEVGALSSQILSTSVQSGDWRVALKSLRLNTVPIVEVSPRKYGICLVIVTALPRPARPVRHPVVTAITA